MKHFITYFFCLNLFGLSAKSTLNPVKYLDSQQKLNGFSTLPKIQTKKKAGVLILPAWKGIDTHAKEVALQLADLGYYAFVADIYGEGNVPKNEKEAGERSSYYKSHVDEYRHRINLALAQLIKSGADANNIMVIGYCFGGTGALETARANMKVKGLVSFHGGLGRDTNQAIVPIIPKVLVCHGADDFFESEEDIKNFQQEMRDSKADWQMNYYADAVHAFTDKSAGNDKTKGVAYNEKADKRSWKAMLDFFDEVSKP